MANKAKVAIIGAGSVGASAAFEMATKNLVGELVLIDVMKDKAFGEALDIAHGLSHVGEMKIYSGDYSDCKDCDVIVVTAGTARKVGETRLDLAKRNTTIAKDITTNIMKYYNRGVIVVVSNPVDVLTYKILKWSGLPANKVFGSGTTLDSVRFQYILSEKFNVDATSVHALMAGEHGDSQVPLWSTASIAGKKIESLLTAEEKEQIYQDVKQAGAVIIKNKGATFYAIAMTINKIVETIIKGHNTVMPVGSLMTGTYGIEDVVLSLPAVVNNNGIDRLFEIDMTDAEIAAIKHSAEQIKAVLNEVKDI